MKKIDGLFQKTLFRKMFYSYVIMILLCVIFYSATIIYENQLVSKERIERKTSLMMEEVDRVMRERIITGQNIVTELNYSSVLKKLYLSKVSGTSMESNYIDIKDEILRTKVVNGFDVAATMIFLNNDRDAYTSSGKINVGDEPFIIPDLEMPYYSVGAVKDLLGFEESKRYSFGKDYFVYLDYYTYQNGTDIGLICILFDLDAIQNELKSVLEVECGVQILFEEQEVLNVGNTNGLRYSMDSELLSGMSIVLWASEDALQESNTIFYVILVFIIVISLGFILLAYRFSGNNYQVIGNIEELMRLEEAAEYDRKGRMSAEEESRYIIEGIEKLIVEKQGYQEKMITITPYANAGMLQGMLSGNISNNAVKVLKEEKYLNLIKPYFVVSAINLVYALEEYDGEFLQQKVRAVFDKVCMLLTAEETRVVYYYQDISNVFLIVNVDTDNVPDDVFFQLQRHLENNLSDVGCQVTIGVDGVRDDIDELKDAYKGALQALDSLIIDGRGAVYFKEDLIMDVGDYYFPGSFKEKLLKALKKGQKEEICSLLKELLDKNLSLSGNSLMYHALVDELHLTIIKALRELTEADMLHMNIEKYTEIATLEEIFGYYESALISALSSVQIEAENQKDGGMIEKEILQYIEQNYCNPDLSLQHLTEHFQVSAKYLGMVCKKYYNTTYLQYLQKRRIEKALDLMERRRYSLMQICEMCGYTSQLTFRRNFKTITGVNPSYYMGGVKNDMKE